MKTAFLFSGQGAQTIGMGKELCEHFPASDAVFETASEALGFDIKEMIFHGDSETLMITENTQPAILTMSIAALEAVRTLGIRPDVVAGLSLGEYSAHVAAGSLDFVEAGKLVKLRGKYMQEEVPVGVGAMAAILALEPDTVREICALASEKGIVEPANFNCPGQITVAGEVAAVEYACELAKEKGAKRAMLLPVSAPFHCSMLKGACSPFDADRDGFVMGEGSGILVLEELEHAKARGAHIIAEVVGYGSTNDAYHMTAPAPDGEGGARCMAAALESAGIQPEDVGYINAHGTSTPYNDKFETAAIKTVFGDHAYKLAVSSTKSMTGHMLGAAGGIEAVITALALEEGFLPPTVNYKNPDPECDLDYVVNQGRKADVTYAISNSLGFGGHNASIVLKKYN